VLKRGHALSWVHSFVDAATIRRVVSRGREIADVETRRRALVRLGRTHEEAVKEAPLAGFDYPQSAVGRMLRRASELDIGRRLALLEGTVPAPYTKRAQTGPTGAEMPASDIGYFEALLRYLVAGTAGCYLVAPEREGAESGFASASGGTSMFVLRPEASKMCFPQIPFMLPRWRSFRELLDAEGVDWKALSYHDQCVREGAAESAYDTLDGWGVVDLPGATGPMRIGQAVDSVEAMAKSVTAKTKYESASWLLCSLVELGGVIYVVAVLFVISCLTICIPILSCLTRLVTQLGAFALTTDGDGDDEGDGGGMAE
jgi:hypothetical protein